MAWQSPSHGYVKCNIDASFISREHKTGFRFCIRDERGVFIIAKPSWLPYLYSLSDGEATGMMLALQWVMQLGLSNVIFELDSKIVVDNINGSCVEEVEFGSLIKLCRELLHSNTNCSVSFTRRHANRDVHSIARATLSFPSCYVFNSFPICNIPFNGLAMI